jgi:hypothetical protein
LSSISRRTAMYLFALQFNIQASRVGRSGIQNACKLRRHDKLE